MNDITLAIEIIKKGGIVVFPTDTSYGIGCRIDDGNAVTRLFEIRRRPSTQATPALVVDISMAERYWNSPILDNVRRLMKNYWPGALTIIFHSNSIAIPSLVRGGGSTLGLRMPNHEIARSLIHGARVPILGPSANFHGKPTPYSYDQLDKKLLAMVDYTLVGVCQTGIVSTVIDCTVTPPKVIRQGAIRLPPQGLQ